MCQLFSTRTTQIWLLGSSIGSFFYDNILPVKEDGNVDRPLFLRVIPDWTSFSQTLPPKTDSCFKRVVIVGDASKLTHPDIAQMRRFRERYDWFIPAIYFDTPDLGKVIHAFNSDLAAYAALGDSQRELGKLIRTLYDGRPYYSSGFCALLRQYGFPIDETYPSNR